MLRLSHNEAWPMWSCELGERRANVRQRLISQKNRSTINCVWWEETTLGLVTSTCAISIEISVRKEWNIVTPFSK